MRDHRREHRLRRLVAAALDREAAIAAALVVGQLGLAFLFSYGLGGASSAPPHWFYVPILYAGLRFGIAGSVPVAVTSALLAGPLLPADVTDGSAQHTSDWVVRGLFFVLVGIALPTMLRQGAGTIQRERRDELMEIEVRRAMDRGEFVLHYQPIFAIDGDRVVGAEALLRWQHPERGLLPPAAFLDDLERLGSIADWVLGEATTAAARWHSMLGSDEFTIAVNVSSQNIAQPGFVAQVSTALRAANLRPDHLCIEITESAAFDDVTRAGARLQVLRSIGVQVALDDFGTGHATLSYLQQLPFDLIKIDRSFVADLGHDNCGATIVANLQRLAGDLGVQCVAEGVETDEQMACLRTIGCTYAQGYLLGRPVPEAAFTDLLLANRSVAGTPDSVS